ncbi:hypothetical protein HDU79_004864 [Rhizoclosmatium sp. JEL0117]|nr:hypothetical protein HDU79_004864 [Rhizoclosmatium sp. JEL0117]
MFGIKTGHCWRQVRPSQLSRHATAASASTAATENAQSARIGPSAGTRPQTQTTTNLQKVLHSNAKVSTIVAAVESATLSELRRLKSDDWARLAAAVAASPKSTPAHDAGRLRRLVDTFKLRNITCKDYSIILAFAKSAVAANLVSSTNDLITLLNDVARVSPSPLYFHQFYLELANSLCRKNQPFLAWDAVNIGSKEMSAMNAARNNPVVLPARIVNNVAREILSCLSFVGYGHQSNCAKGRSVIKELIQMHEEDGQFIGDFPYIVMAKLSSSTDAKDAFIVSANARYTSDAVTEFLEYACVEKKWEPTSEAYNHLVFHALRASNVKLASDLLEKSKYQLDFHLCRRILRELGKLGQMELAEKCYQASIQFDAAKKPSTEDINTYIESIVEEDAKSFDLQQELVQAWTVQEANPQSIKAVDNFMERFSTDIPAWTISTLYCVASFYVRAALPIPALKYFNILKQSAKAMNLSQEATSEETSPFVRIEAMFNQLLYAFAKSGDFKAIMELYDDKIVNGRSLQINVETCTVLVSTFGVTYPEAAARFLDDYESTGRTADVILYTSLISCHIRGNRLPQSIQLFQRMKSKGVSPNVNTFNAVVQGLCVSGKIESAMEFVKTMDKAKVAPDTATFNTLLTAVLKRSRWSDADMLVRQMEDRGLNWDRTTFNIWINAHIRREGGNVEEAERLFEQMQRAPYFFRPSHSTYDAHLYHHLFRKDWTSAELLVRDMYPLVQGPSQVRVTQENAAAVWKSYRILISALAAAGERDRAEVHYRTLVDSMWGTYSAQVKANLASIRIALVKAAAKDGDLEYCRDMMNDFIATEGVANDSLNAVMITAFSLAGDFRGAVEWANQIIPGAGIGTTTLAKIKGISTHGRSSKKDAASGNENWNDLGFGRGSSYALMLAYARAGDLEGVLAIHKQMLNLESWGFSNYKEFKKPGQAYSINEANVLLNCCTLLKNGTKALEIWKSMWRYQEIKRNERSRATPRGPSSMSSQGLVEIFGVDRITVSLIIDSLSFSKMPKELDAIWKTVKEVFPLDLNNYISYSESLARRGDLRGCLTFLEKEIIDGNHKLKLEPKIFWSVCKLLNRQKDSQYIEGWWELMRRRCPEFEQEVIKKTQYKLK